MSDRNAPARLSCETKLAATTSTIRLSPLQTVPAQYGSAGPANSQRRRNLRAIGYHRKRTRVSHLITCTYNCRSVNTATQLTNLIEEAQRISYHVIGLSETKRRILNVHMERRDCDFSWSSRKWIYFRRNRLHSGTWIHEKCHECHVLQPSPWSADCNVD